MYDSIFKKISMTLKIEKVITLPHLYSRFYIIRIYTHIYIIHTCIIYIYYTTRVLYYNYKDIAQNN